jgi:hypothetical protein
MTGVRSSTMGPIADTLREPRFHRQLSLPLGGAGAAGVELPGEYEPHTASGLSSFFAIHPREFTWF